MRSNPNPRSRARGMYIPPCGGEHGQETTYMNWCYQCRDIRKLELLQEQNVLLESQLEDRGYQPRRVYTPPPPLPPAPEKKIPSGGANVQPRSSSTA